MNQWISSCLLALAPLLIARSCRQAIPPPTPHQSSTEALLHGFDETLWIDSDLVFNIDKAIFAPLRNTPRS